MELHVTKRKGREIVVLLDNDMRIVKPVYDYLKYQDQRDRAINTLIAYGNDLKAFWEFLSDYGYAYDEVSPKMIGEYKEYLMSEDDNIIAINKEGARTAKTINRMLSTLHGFYQYKADMQEIDNPLLMHEVNRPFNAFKGILEHARSDNKTKQSIFKVKESNYKINLVSDDDGNIKYAVVANSENRMYDYLSKWHDAYICKKIESKLVDTQEERERILKNYARWKSKFPKSIKNSKDLKENQKQKLKKKIEELQSEYERLH